MGKLIDADLLLADLRERKSDRYWGIDTSYPFAQGVVYDIDYYIYEVNAGRYDAPEELQPEPPRQTLVEALEVAAVGTRFRHKHSASESWVVVVAPGISYLHESGNKPGPIDNEYYPGKVRYADEFYIEYPIY